MVSFGSEKDTQEEAACTCHRLCLPSGLVRHMSAVFGASTLHSPCLAEKKWQPRAKCREVSLGKRQPLEVTLHPGSTEPDLTCTPRSLFSLPTTFLWHTAFPCFWFFVFNCSTVGLQCCVSFWRPAKWFRDVYTHIYTNAHIIVCMC